MAVVSGEVLGRRLLRLDAVYCAGAGLIAVALFAPIARLLEAPQAVPAVAGAVAIGWALVLRSLARRPGWRVHVGSVAAANAVAAGAIAALAVLAPATAARLLLAAVALEVGAFAVAQVVALRR
jgi:hypothetical protein